MLHGKLLELTPQRPHVAIEAPKQVHARQVCHSTQCHLEGSEQRRQLKLEDAQCHNEAPGKERCHHEPRKHGAENERPHDDAIGNVTVVDPCERGHLEDAPQPRGVAGVPQNDHLARAVQEGADARDALLLSHRVGLFDASLVQEDPLLRAPEHQEHEEGHHAPEQRPQGDAGPVVWVAALDIRHWRQQAHRGQERRRHRNKGARDRGSWEVVLKQQDHGLKSRVAPPTVRPEVVDYLRLETHPEVSASRPALAVGRVLGGAAFLARGRRRAAGVGAERCPTVAQRRPGAGRTEELR
mmetsp:Transcript_124826/g.361082  ORF Transcript_124826/g.361082 Transcript_124826/m.361082 type:complete len:297 (-) Transcript_124826:566-1456(-)